jgi:hypothetical protein
MKTLLLTIAIASTSFLLNAKLPTEYEFQNSDKYTAHYKLFTKSEGMRIFKQTKESSVKCWVEINTIDSTIKTKAIVVDKIKFKKDPLRSCLKVSDVRKYL